MLVNLFYIVFIELIAIEITTSKSLENDHDIIDASDYQRLLEMYQDGHVKNNHKHQQERHHSKPHGDSHNLMNIQTVNLIVKHNDLKRNNRAEKKDLINKDGSTVNKVLCAITGSYGCSITPKDNKLLTGANLNKAKEKLHYARDGEGSDNPEYDNNEVEAQKDLELLLGDLEQLLGRENGELRCRGNRCGRERGDQGEDDDDDDGDQDQLRCGHNRCGSDYDRNLRCNGDRCGRCRADDDGKDDLRCRGDRCGRCRTDDDRKEDLRCRGNRCYRENDIHNDLRCRKRCRGRSGDDDNSSDSRGNVHDDLRCKKCSRGRTADDDDNGTRDENGNDELRYECNRCGGHDDNRKDEIETDELRCSGDRCGLSRSDITSANIDNDFKPVLENYGKIYKINNELDAIVLDVNKLENGLQRLYSNFLRNKNVTF